MTSAMTGNRTTELREKLKERGVEYQVIGKTLTYWNRDGSHNDYDDADYVAYEQSGSLTVEGLSPEQAIAATLGSDDRYDAGFSSGVQAVFQQLEGIEDYEELQDLIAEYWGEGEGNDER